MTIHPFRLTAIAVGGFSLAVTLAACGSSGTSVAAAATSGATQVAQASATPSVPDDSSESPACALLPTATFKQVFDETPTNITPSSFQMLSGGQNGQSECTYNAANSNGDEGGQVTITVYCGPGVIGDEDAVEGASNGIPQVGPNAYEELDTYDQPMGYDFPSDTEAIEVDNDLGGNDLGQPASGSENAMVSALVTAARNDGSVKPCAEMPSATASPS